MGYKFGTEALEELSTAIRSLEKVGYNVGFGLDENDEMAADLIALQRAARNFKRKYADRIKAMDNE